MSRLLRWLALLGLLVLASVVIASVVIVRPWLSPPPASRQLIAENWARVEQLAAQTRYPDGSIETLKVGLEYLKHYEETPGNQVTLPWNVTQPPKPVTDNNGQQALAALVDWAAQGGGIGGDLCAESLPVVEVDHLALLALGQAAGDRDPAFNAALRLGAYLRNRGSLLSAWVGFEIADNARAAMEARGTHAGPAFVSFAPRREEVVPALARQAVCDVRIAETALATGTRAGTGLLERRTATWAGPERELAMLRWWWGERIAAAAAAGDDLAAVAATQAIPGVGSLPASHLVRLMAPNTSEKVRDMDAILTRYAAFAGSPQ